MQLFRSTENLPPEFRRCALSIGNFDGVHNGHAQLVARIVHHAKRVGGKSLIFTFDPHPASLLRPELAPVPLTWTERKAELLSRLGIDGMVAYPTDERLLSLSPTAFFDEIIIKALGAAAVVEGPNFCFGKDRTGNVQLMEELCKSNGVEFEVATPVKVDDDNEFVSSSRIRQELSHGNLGAANDMLTRPHRVRGTVGHGAGRGATIGFPTANLTSVDTLLPAEGVYAGRSKIGDKEFAAAINIGPSPTFGDANKRIEVHLIGFNGSLYGELLKVDFLNRLRSIHSFEGPAALVNQLNMDITAAKEAYRQIR
ncbi:bifunctional riboflavin kinase/FAD synthetase [Planctomycetota bacterium]